MKKLVFVAFAVFMIAGLVGGVFAVEQLQDISEDTIEFVKKFVKEKKEIVEADVIGIKKIDLENPPEGIIIEKVEDTNIALYEVNYNEDNQNKKVFVLTYGDQDISQQVDYKNVQYLTFTDSLDSDEERFLMIESVRGSEELGYVMLDRGSITGLSSVLEITNSSVGEIELVIYKNGEDVGFRNSIDSSQAGVEKDFDLQSENVIEFEPGDVISVKASSTGDAGWKNVITTLKIATEVKK